ncbi:hypothetical protein LCGC14_1210440 [marine sediment metagenome]|uniref:HNH domain-containing protein n=1 Tax=marine sediment metagenome TaxID=412755 RepID=A0A0F9PIU0_9ZZZZ
MKCPVCLKGKTESPHHIVPRSHGGTDEDSNLIDVCLSCHDELETLADKGIYFTPRMALLLRLSGTAFQNNSEDIVINYNAEAKVPVYTPHTKHEPSGNLFMKYSQILLMMGINPSTVESSKLLVPLNTMIMLRNDSEPSTTKHRWLTADEVIDMSHLKTYRKQRIYNHVVGRPRISDGMPMSRQTVWRRNKEKEKEGAK